MAENETMLLRVFLCETDHHNHKPTYQQIVARAHELGLAGATVLRGMMGFTAGSEIHSTKVLRLSDDLPVVVEIVDSEENLRLLLPYLDEALDQGLVTLEKVRVLRRITRKTD